MDRRPQSRLHLQIGNCSSWAANSVRAVSGVTKPACSGTSSTTNSIAGSSDGSPTSIASTPSDRKLLFMGGEFGQGREWSHEAGLQWDQLDDEQHRGIQRWIADLNRVYTS